MMHLGPFDPTTPGAARRVLFLVSVLVALAALGGMGNQ